MQRAFDNPSPNRPPKLCVGIGNVLQHDDGVGVHAAQVMMNLPLDRIVEVYDAGTGGFDVANALEGRQRVVIMDAIDCAAQPGTILRFGPDEVRPRIRDGLSLHDVHLLDSLQQIELLGTAPREVIFLTVQAADVSTGIGLSPPVAAALPGLLRRAGAALGLPLWMIELAATQPPRAHAF